MESTSKRKIEDIIELAKQKAQDIAARLISDSADSNKRPRPRPPPSQLSSIPVSYTPQTRNALPTTKQISIPSAKVGVIIGRGGDMIKNLQSRSGARIQIARDHEVLPSSTTRHVELMGTQDQIARAHQLIIDTIAEADASGNRSSLPPLQSGADQFVIRVPNDKVALVIGKGGETIKTMQNTSGARIQVVPLRLPPGDTSTERNVYINGTQEQIESAKELVNEVISGNRLKVLSGSNAYTQTTYGEGGWASQGHPPAQHPPAYGYTGSYGVSPAPYYAGWEQQANTTAPYLNSGYTAYGQVVPNSTQPYPYTNSAYGPPATSDGSAAGQTQLGYGAPFADGQPPPPAGYNQATAAPANGYSACPSYSCTPPSVQPTYSQTDYPHTDYGQQQEGQVTNQASYSHYGQYPSAESTAQQSYYQSAYPAVPPPQVLPQIQTQAPNGVPHTVVEEGGNPES